MSGAAGEDHGEQRQLAIQALQRGDSEAAQDHALQAVSSAPLSPEAYALLGDALCMARELPQAQAAYRRALALDADCERAHLGLWMVFKLLGRRPDMVNRFKQALAAASEPRGPAASLPYLADVTLCCVDCLNHDLAARALGKSLEQCRFADTVLLSDRVVDLTGVRSVAIPRIRSAEAYSAFVLKELGSYIHTRWVLLVQWDGYVVDGSLWSEAFLDYDYVGACWPVSGAMRVGNGGFSLRSKKLLDALADDAIPVAHPEDELICSRQRHYLESRHGIRFAPDAVAERFSFEYGPRQAGGTFGFHGVMNMARHMGLKEFKTLEAIL